MKINKWTYEYVLQGHYGCGWEDLTYSDTWKEAVQYRKDYEQNERGTYRIIKRRVLTAEMAVSK